MSHNLIKYLLVLILILIETLTVVAQGMISGVYFGSFVTEQNAIIISVKGSYFDGVVYLRASEKIIINGVVLSDSVKGVLMHNQQTKIFKGLVHGDSLTVNLFSEVGGFLKACELKKISSKANYDIKKLFPETDHELDSILIGGWVRIKIIGNQGIEKKSKYNYKEYYYANGTFWFESETLNSYKNSMPSYSWSVESGNLIITRHALLAAFPSESEHLYSYFIRGDTLMKKDDHQTEVLIKIKTR